jgi:hypothetical protein
MKHNTQSVNTGLTELKLEPADSPEHIILLRWYSFITRYETVGVRNASSLLTSVLQQFAEANKRLLNEIFSFCTPRMRQAFIKRAERAKERAI